MKTALTVPGAPAAPAYYSQAIKSGNFLFVSGQLPLNPATGKVEDTSIEGQTKQVCENLKTILSAAGKDLSAVVKTNVYLKNMEHFAIMNGIYASYFTPPAPARACVEVSRLPRDVLVEIECIAEV